MTSVYRPDVPGATETRQYVRFMASELNRINGVPDHGFTEIVNNIEEVIANKLPGAPTDVVAWAMFVFGDMLAQRGGSTEGLFWQAVADDLITREETRDIMGEDMMPRPKATPHEVGEPCTCGEVHVLETAEEMIAHGKKIIQGMEREKQALDGIKSFVQNLRDKMGRDDLPGQPLTPPDVPGAENFEFRGGIMPGGTPLPNMDFLPPGSGGAFALPVDSVAEFGMDNVMRFVIHKVTTGTHNGVISADELREWLKDNPA